jgi:glycine cleavage system regulatory protein
MSGEPLFKAEALLKVPTGFKLERLQLELEDLADDLIVEIRSA